MTDTTKPTWASNTNGKGTAPYKLVMQDDRNLCVYDRYNNCTWASNTYQQQQSWNQVRDTLNSENKLDQNATITSKNGYYHARMQDDGNFVIYNGTNFQSQNAVWASNTGGVSTGPFHLSMQNDGNLVIYDRNSKPTWASNTWNKGSAPYRLVMQDDRNLVVYDRNNTATWASNSNI